MLPVPRRHSPAAAAKTHSASTAAAVVAGAARGRMLAAGGTGGTGGTRGCGGQTAGGVRRQEESACGGAWSASAEAPLADPLGPRVSPQSAWVRSLIFDSFIFIDLVAQAKMYHRSADGAAASRAADACGRGRRRSSIDRIRRSLQWLLHSVLLSDTLLEGEV